VCSLSVLSSVLLLCFSLYCSRTRRDLLSFPTRRSSDLVTIGRSLPLPDGGAHQGCVRAPGVAAWVGALGVCTDTHGPAGRARLPRRGGARLLRTGRSGCPVATGSTHSTVPQRGQVAREGRLHSLQQHERNESAHREEQWCRVVESSWPRPD